MRPSRQIHGRDDPGMGFYAFRSQIGDDVLDAAAVVPTTVSLGPGTDRISRPRQEEGELASVERQDHGHGRQNRVDSHCGSEP